ncbi:hypothetical protein SDC9_186239 [bioreactor metagenome]|uniref:Uncharacterized protein n=1 Tax=bioreactor metagenome TaxID=1076179 RepID=A0A645HRE6_9ZZZZ
MTAFFAGQVVAIDDDAALAGGHDPGQNAHQGGLAGAIGAKQAKHARFDLQVHTPQGLNVFLCGVVGFM